MSSTRPTPDPDPFGLVPAFSSLGERLAHQPEALWDASWNLASSMALLPMQVAAALETGGPLPEVGKDPRFSDDAWRWSPWHALLASQYALARRTTLGLVGDAKDLDAVTRRKVEFFTEQWLDLWAPSNFLGTNPTALLKAWHTAGGSLFQGYGNFIQDRLRDAAIPSQSDLSAFQVGENLATTAGRVVARNHLVEVIQYTPTTEKVHACPVLVISPWIGKYYILDLTERQSFVRHLLDQGYTVFALSWKNPDASMADTGFEDYVKHGILFARDVAASITAVPDPVAIGYCIGGAALATTQAWLKGAGQVPFRAIGLMTAMVDYEDCGAIKVFIDERAIRHIERNMEKRGYLTSDEMAVSFGLLRARELVWSYFVDNYLLGNTPPPFDLLYWNADGTRMPRAMHTWYLRTLYLQNLLRVPNAVKILGVPIDLGRITEDVYLLGTEKDHIAPWTSVYKLTRYVRGDVRFVLATSGHIAGVINPPSSGKGQYRTASEGAAGPVLEPETWLARSESHKGSWWMDYTRWLETRTGPLQDPPSMGNPTWPAREAAPGTYVLER